MVFFSSDGSVCIIIIIPRTSLFTGRLGYGEVVQVSLPTADPSTYRKFSDEYFSLFGKDNERPDKGDLGPEYRSLVGIPGGLSGGSPLAEQLKQAAAVKGIALMEGRGDDADTLGDEYTL